MLQLLSSLLSILSVLASWFKTQEAKDDGVNEATIKDLEVKKDIENETTSKTDADLDAANAPWLRD